MKPIESGSGDDEAVVGVGIGATVVVAGPANRAAVTEASRSLRGLIEAGVRHLVVDVSGVYDVDGRLLTVLARTRARLADLDAPATGSLTVVGVVLPQFLPALQAAGPDEVFVIYDAVRRGSRTVALPRPRRAWPRRESWICREPVRSPLRSEPSAVAAAEPVEATAGV